MLPFDQENLKDIQQLLNIEIDLTNFHKGEERLLNTIGGRLLCKLIELPELTLKVLFEEYEGYLNVEVEGTGQQFNKVAKYLHDKYIACGGNLKYLVEPNYFK